jgi:hypothetical protein
MTGYKINFPTYSAVYSHAPHNDVLVDGPHIRVVHNIIMFTAVLQLSTAFSTVTCCRGL